MNDELHQLLKLYFDGKATEAEIVALMEMVIASGDIELEAALRERWEAMQDPEEAVPDGAHVLSAILDEPTPVRTMHSRWYWAAASAVLLAIGLGAYVRLHHTKGSANELTQTLSPASKHVTLVLDDGSVIQLDSAGHRVLQQGGTVVRQQGDQLVYGTSNGKDVLAFNTLKTPPGSQFTVTLPDGTVVSLNAASSIRYPTSFTGKERRVEVTGEAYFSIAANTEMPFKVGVNGNAEITVLGTEFNVNAYEDEGIIKTTLINGAVSMSGSNSRSVLLKPGQQAQLNSAGINVIKNPDVEQVLAWRNGLFNFNHTDLKSVMKELSRWYNVDVRYEGDLPARTFRGKIPRDLPLAQVLEILQDVEIRFRVDGKTIVVYN